MPRRRHSNRSTPRSTKLQFSYKKSDRNWNTPEYRKWRDEIRKRDNKTCQMPRCGSTKAIKVHHIIRWVDAPSLRFEPRNGICLCRVCHDRITGHESSYVKLFRNIVDAKYK